MSIDVVPIVILILFFSSIAIFFYYKWLCLRRENRELVLNLAMRELTLASSLGGYYLWEAYGDKELFSANLANIFNLRKGIRTIDKFVVTFSDGGDKLLKELKKLKARQIRDFEIKLQAKISGKRRHFKCNANRIETADGATKAVILWFYDISDYINHFNKIVSENEVLSAELEDCNSILNHIPIPIWKRNDKLEVVYANKAYKRFLGKKYDEEQHDERNKLDELSKRSADVAKFAINDAKIHSEKLHLICDGFRRLFNVIEIPDKKQGATVGYAEDITKQEDIERELKRNISAHADLLESSSSAMAVYGTDKKLKFYNNAFTSLWALSEKWLDSEPSYGEVLEVLRKKRKLPEQANFDEFRKKQLRLFTDVITTYNEFFYLPDGKVLRVIVIPHALGGLLFAYEDITDRLTMERSFNTLLAVQKATLDNLYEGIAVFGADARLKLYNPKYQQLWGYKTEMLDSEPHILELIEASKGMFKYDGNWEEYGQDILAEITERKSTVTRYDLKGGQIMERISVPLPDGATLVSYVDITDEIMIEKTLRERNDALEEADKMKTDFLANVSYELRTPLTSILGFSEALDSNFCGKLNKKQKEYVQDIVHSSTHLKSMINDILDIASFEAGDIALDIKDVDVCRAINGVVRLMNKKIVENGLKVDVVCSAKKIGAIAADESRIKQMLYNLLDNAIKFSHKGGKIKVVVSSDSRKNVVIKVADSGIGIAKDELNKVFDRFYKTKSAEKLNKVGTGLGLSIVRNIIDLHGGKIKLQSKENGGTTVVCSFKKKGV